MGVERIAFPSPTMRPLDGTHISYEVECQVRLDYGLVELGKFHWPRPVESVLTSEEDVFSFNLALSPRPSRAMISHLDRPINDEPESIGRVVLINPGCTFRLSVPSGQVRSLYCGIDRRKLEQIVGDLGNFDERKSQMQFKANSSIIEWLLNRIYEEIREDRFASELAIDSYANSLCVELARCLRAGEVDRADSHKGGLAPWRMRRLLERIHAKAPAPHLPELAELCGMTARQLSRAFKVETGKTLGKFIDEVIVERAIRLLTESDCPINEIAMELGFAASASFTYFFRRATGNLPRELRRRGAA